ncbi:MAG: hypothetical protein V1776_05665 [Candidatus Diapherotrites archaeon]
MLVTENRGQVGIEVLVGIVITVVVATVAALIMKGLYSSVQPNVAGQTNTVVNTIV